MSRTFRDKKNWQAKQQARDDDNFRIQMPWRMHIIKDIGLTVYGIGRRKFNGVYRFMHKQRNRKVRHHTKNALKTGQFWRMFHNYNGNRRWSARK